MDSQVGSIGFVILMAFGLVISIVIRQNRAKAIAAASLPVPAPVASTATTPNQRAIHNINLHQVTILQTTAIPSSQNYFPNSSVLFPRVGEPIQISRQQSSTDNPPAYTEIVDPHLHPPSYETVAERS